MRAFVGIIGWLVAALAIFALVFSGLCGVLGLFGRSEFFGVAFMFGAPALVAFLLARELFRWGFRRPLPLDRSQGGNQEGPPSSAA